MGQPWDTTSHIFSQILGHTSLKFTLSLISGNWVYYPTRSKSIPKDRDQAEVEEEEVAEQPWALPEAGGAAGAPSPGSLLFSDARLLFNITDFSLIH